MIVSTHPVPGTVVRVDLSVGFRPPEMVKRRPAIVLSPPIHGRADLCSIVPLSTTAPKRVCPNHLQLHFAPPLPHTYTEPLMWLKGDIVLTVAFHRLRLLFRRTTDGAREPDIRVLDAETRALVQRCVRAGLGL